MSGVSGASPGHVQLLIKLPHLLFSQQPVQVCAEQSVQDPLQERLVQVVRMSDFFSLAIQKKIMPPIISALEEVVP